MFSGRSPYLFLVEYPYQRAVGFRATSQAFVTVLVTERPTQIPGAAAKRASVNL